MSAQPGWVKPCTCGKTERGAYCTDCRAFGDGYSGGTWERPVLDVQSDDVTPEVLATREAFLAQVDEAERERWCDCSPCTSARIVGGNAVHCNACDGRLRPTATSDSTRVGTGH